MSHGQYLPVLRHLRFPWLLLGFDILAKQLESKLAIVNFAALVLIIGFEQSAQLSLGVIHACLFENAAKLVKVYVAFAVSVEVLEHLDKAGFFGELMVCSLNQFVSEI